MTYDFVLMFWPLSIFNSNGTIGGRVKFDLWGRGVDCVRLWIIFAEAMYMYSVYYQPLLVFVDVLR